MTDATPPKADKQEIATSHDGRDITQAFIGALVEVQDTVLRRLGNNYEAYRELRRDGQVHATFQQRRLALVSRPLVIQPGADDAKSVAAADALRENLAQIPFDRACDKQMNGIFYGHSVGECLWQEREGRVWLERVKVRTPWRFRYAPDGSLRLLTRTNMTTGETMPDRKFWTVSWGADNDDDPYGLGLAHQLYWPVFFRKQGLAFWLRALEKFGGPTVVAKYPAGTPLPDQQAALSAAQRLRLDAAVAIPDTMTLELLEAMRGTVDQATFHRQMTAEISKIILGQTMTTDDGASLSQSQVHMEVREELTDSDAELQCESFMNGPARWLTEWNFPGAEIPLITRPAPEDQERAAKQVEAKAKAVQAMRAAGFEPEPETIENLFGKGWRPAKPIEPAVPNGGPAFAEPQGPTSDPVDRYVEAADWSNAMEEPIAFLEGWVANIGSLAEARDRLPELLSSLPTEQLRTTLSQACLEAALAGRLDLNLQA